MRKFLLLLSTICSVCSLDGCGSSDSPPEDARIGIVAVLLGPRRTIAAGV